MELSRYENLGLNSTELTLYLTLAEVGRASAHQLSKRSEIKRTTTYSALENLVARGLVGTEKKNNVTQFIAHKPDSIVSRLKREREELLEKEELAKEFSFEVEGLLSKKVFHPHKVKQVEGFEGVNAFLHEHSPIWQKSISEFDNTWWGYQDNTFVAIYMEWLEHHWKRMLPVETIKLLSNKSPLEESLEKKISTRIIKEVPLDYNFTSTIWVLGDYIVMIMSRETPNYATQIYDPVFAANLRVFFQLLWKGYSTLE